MSEGELSSVTNEISVLLSWMRKKYRNKFVRAVQILYSRHDSHAPVKAGLKALYEELYTDMEAIVVISPCSINCSREIKRYLPFIHMSFSIDFVPYEVLIYGRPRH